MDHLDFSLEIFHSQTVPWYSRAWLVANTKRRGYLYVLLYTLRPFVYIVSSTNFGLHLLPRLFHSTSPAVEAIDFRQAAPLSVDLPPESYHHYKEYRKNSRILVS